MEREETELVRHPKSPLKDPPLTRMRWEKTVKEGKVPWTKRVLTEEGKLEEKRALLYEICRKGPVYIIQPNLCQQ